MTAIESARFDRPTVRVALAVVIVAAAFLLRQILVLRFGIELPPFISFYPAVMIVAVLCGVSTGLLATLLSALLVAYWVFPPIGQFAISSTSQAISLDVFIGMGVFMSAVAGRYRQYQLRVAAFERERALRETNQQLQQMSASQQALFANMDEGFASGEVLYDDSGAPCDYRVLEVNKAYEKQTGLQAEIVVDKTTLQTFPDIERSWIEKLGKVAATGEAERFENFNHNTGKHYETFAYSPSRGKFSFLIRDVTERKRADEALRESEERFRLMVEAIEDCAIFMLDPEGRVANWNAGAERLKGYTAGEILGRHFSCFYRPEDIAAGKPQRELAIAAEKGKYAEEGWRTRKDGSQFMAAVTITAIRNAEGQFRGFSKFTRDVTQRRRADEALQESEQRLRFFIEYAPAALAMFDDKMRYLHASRRWLTDYGQGERDLRGVSHYDVFPEIPEQWKDAHLRGLAGEVVKEEAELFERADGSKQWLRWEIRPWRDAAGKVGGILIFTEEITGRKQAEKALQSSRERLAAIIGSAMDAVITIGADQHILVFNAAAEKIFGCPAAEAIGHPLDRFIPAAIRADHRRHVEAFAGSGSTSRSMHSPGILSALRANGDEFPIEATISQVTVDGEPLYTVILRDITERKRAEEERETTIEFLRLVNESRGTRDLIQRAATFIQQQSQCEAIGIRLRDGDDYPYFEARGFPKDFVVAENLLCARDPFGAVIRDSSGNPVVECMCGNVICGRFDPSKSFFTTHGAFWSNGTTEMLARTTEADRQSATRNRCNGAGYESVALIPLRVRDERLGLLQLNDRRRGRFSAETIAVWEHLADHLAVALSKFRADDALQQSEAQFRELAEGIPQLAWMANADGWIFWYNQRWYRYTGTTPQQMEGWGWQSVHDPKELPKVMEQWKGSIATGQPFDMVFPLLGADNVFRPFLTRIMPLRDSQGRVARWFGTNTDISAQKQAEEALLRSEKLATVGRMAAAIAHEINNPLTAVTNLLFLVRSNEELPDSARQYLDTVDAELKRVAHITRLSLGYYRESEAVTNVSLSAVLESALDLLKSKINAKQAVIEKDWDEDVEVTAKAGELRQVFSNLIINGLDAIDEGGTLKVRMSAARPNLRNRKRCVRVTIADNGPGIGAGARKQIFEAFFTTKGSVGTGLGLWVTSQIVDKHSGTIRMRSSTSGARRGTSFSVVLPVDPAAAQHS